MVTQVAQYKNLLLEKEGVLGTIFLNRPDKLNALNEETKMEIAQAVEALNKDGSVRVIILTGTGEKAFCAGADINELKNLNGMAGQETAMKGQKLALTIEHLEKPVIAAINGYALGGGCELAMACDIRIASENARFGQPEVNLAILPGFGGTQRLPRLVGKGKAMEMILTGDQITAQEALQIGLVDKVVPPGKALEAAKEMGKKIASKGPLAIQMAKQAIHMGLQVDLDRGCHIEALYFGAVCSTEDKTEGCSAFLEKRQPNFRGR